jgi:hypothetical protein
MSTWERRGTYRVTGEMNVDHVQSRTTDALVLLIALSVGLVCVAGCGGSGPALGGNTGASGGVVPVSQSKGLVNKDLRLAVYWAERSSNEVTLQTDAPSSALSFVLTLKDAAQNGSDYTFTGNRRADPTAYLETYKLPGKIHTGSTWASVEFHAQPNGRGDVVGVALAAVVLRANGTGLEEIATKGTVASVEVPPGQALEVGETKRLVCEVATANGQILAVTPGSIFWNVVEGEQYLRFEGTQATGLTDGVATVTATVDQVRSAPATVTVGDVLIPGGPGPQFSIDPIAVALACSPPNKQGQVTGDSRTVRIIATNASGQQEDWKIVSVDTTEGDLVQYKPSQKNVWQNTNEMEVQPKALPLNPFRRNGTVHFTLKSRSGKEGRLDVTVCDPEILTAYAPDDDELREPVLELTWVNDFSTETGWWTYAEDGYPKEWAMRIANPRPPAVDGDDPNQNSWSVFGACAIRCADDGDDKGDHNLPWTMQNEMAVLAVRPARDYKGPLNPPLRAVTADDWEEVPGSWYGGLDDHDNHYFRCEPWRPKSQEHYKPMGLGMGYDHAKPENHRMVYVREELTEEGQANTMISGWEAGLALKVPGMPWWAPFSFFGANGVGYHFLWAIGVAQRTAATASLLAPGTFTQTAKTEAPGTNEPAPGTPPSAAEHPEIRVLKVNLPTLKGLERKATEAYFPSLTDLQTPPSVLLPPVEQNATLVPWTTLGDPEYATAQARRTASPCYRVDRDVAYKLTLHQVNPTSATQPGVELSVKTGYSDTNASSATASTGMSHTS